MADLAAMSRFIRLPYGGVWAELVLAPSDRLSVNVRDLQGYCYLLRWPGAMERNSSVGPPLRDEDSAALGFPVDARAWFAALRKPAMGDAKVPDLAQLVH